jgi:hypothetical protein
MSVGSNDRKWHSQYPELGTDPVPIEPYISPEFFELERDRVFRLRLAMPRPRRAYSESGRFLRQRPRYRTHFYNRGAGQGWPHTGLP